MNSPHLWLISILNTILLPLQGCFPTNYRLVCLSARCLLSVCPSVLVFLGSAQSALIPSWTSPGSMYVSLRGPVCWRARDSVHAQTVCAVLPGTVHTIPKDPCVCVCVCRSVCVLASLQLSPHIHPFSDDRTSQWISLRAATFRAPPRQTHSSNNAFRTGAKSRSEKRELAHQCVQRATILKLDGQPVFLWDQDRVPHLWCRQEEVCGWLYSYSCNKGRPNKSFHISYLSMFLSSRHFRGGHWTV